MGVNSIENTGGSNEGGFRDMAAKRHQEASFEQMLDIDVNQPKHEQDFSVRRGERPHFEEADVGRPSDLFGGPGDDAHGPHRSSVDHDADLREQAADLREQAAELREEAATLRSGGGQVNEHRAIALEQRAEAREKEADSVDARAADRAEDRRLNGGGQVGEPVEGGEPEPVEGEVVPRDQDVLPVEGWAPAEQVAAYTQELNAIEGFEGLEVTDTREATDNEVEAFLDLADEMGLEDSAFAEGFLQAFPIQFVYVEDLEAQGFDTATLGEVLFDNKTIILMDSEYAIDDITLDTSPAGEAARENAELSYTSIIDVMIEMEAMETAAMPSSLGMETMDESEEEDEATTQTAGLASAPVSGTSDTDADPDE